MMGDNHRWDPLTLLITFVLLTLMSLSRAQTLTTTPASHLPGDGTNSVTAATHNSSNNQHAGTNGTSSSTEPGTSSNSPEAISTEEQPRPTLSPDLRRIFSRPAQNQNEEKEYWRRKAQEDLARSLNIKLNTNRAKNVILFLGDGLGIPTIVASRIYKGQLRNISGEEQELFFEVFPHVALSKTYCVDKQVADSACSGTAYLTGVKTNINALGVDSRVAIDDCTTMTEDSKVSSIAHWALQAGKRAGIVTSTSITHATPAATYAHTNHRDTECDAMITEEIKNQCPQFKDIARQLIEDEPGKNFNVIMGGGYQMLSAGAANRTGDPVQQDECYRQDGRDLFQQWQDEKQSEGKTFSAVRTKSELMGDQVNEADYLLGIFANVHLPYEYEKLKENLDIPSLEEMTVRAIEVLQRGDEGFFLLVEGGRIDHAHHASTARKALEETLAFEDAIKTALQLVDTEETLVVVTADHSHVMTINGYPDRGQDITGLADVADDQLPYTTLMYTNGRGFNYTSVNETTGGRWNITEDPVTDMEYVQLGAVPRNSETHGGEDVSIYAIGPMAHLFHGVHEQNYIPHVMGYAACIGANTEHCDVSAASQPLAAPLGTTAMMAVTLLHAIVLWLFT